MIPMEVKLVRKARPNPVPFRKIGPGLWALASEPESCRCVFVSQSSMIEEAEYEYTLVIADGMGKHFMSSVGEGWRSKEYVPAGFSLQITLNPPDLGVK